MNRIFEYPDTKQIIVSGDIHGDFKTLVYRLCMQYEMKDTLLIVAGDCGFGFELPGYYDLIYNSVAGRLRKANNWIVFVRGNHDDPSYFEEEKVPYRRWRCVPDYPIIKACGHNILCVGGAVSIDRQIRIQKNMRRNKYGHNKTACWWNGEPPVFEGDAIESIPKEILIDTVISHSCPSLCNLNETHYLKAWAENDPDLIKDVADERIAIDNIHHRLVLNNHPVKQWFYGHFHRSQYEVIDGIRYSMLDIMEFKEIQQVKTND